MALLWCLQHQKSLSIAFPTLSDGTEGDSSHSTPAWLGVGLVRGGRNPLLCSSHCEVLQGTGNMGCVWPWCMSQGGIFEPGSWDRVMVLAGTELVFFVEAGTVLCFVFLIKIAVVTH